MNAKFLSTWGAALPHHITQMGHVLGAEFMPLTGEGVNSLLSNMEDGHCPDFVIVVTRMVNKPETIREAKRLVNAILGDERCHTKTALLDIEGIAYLELAHLKDGTVSNKVPMGDYFWLANHVDLNISMSRSVTGLFESIAPNVPCCLFGFIPEPDAVYDNLYRTRKGYMEDPNYLNIWIGAKAGPARRALTDIMTAVEIGRRLGKRVAIHVPKNDQHTALYEDIFRSLEGTVLGIYEPQILDYPGFLARLATMDLVVNLDPIDGASRLASECARIGVPCLGMRHSYYQELFFPYLSVDVADPRVAARNYIESRKSSRLYKYIEHAKEISNEQNREKTIAAWRGILEEIGVEV